MSYAIVVSEEVRAFLHAMDRKSKGICKKNIEKLSQPYPGRGVGDKEKIVIDGEEIYRLHIRRTYTAFYIIDEQAKIVRVLELLPIEAAHKKYGY